MKKKLFVSMICVFFLANTRAQELLVGGNMEDETKWQFSSPNGSDVTDLVTATFNYTDDLPASGSGGCLDLTGFGTTRSVAWQGVTLTPGHSYRLKGFLKNISLSELTNTWVEVILSRSEPDPSKDYGAGTGDYIYTNNSWMEAPYGNFVELDGELIETTQFLMKNVLPGDVKDSVLTSSIITMPDSISVNSWFVSIKAGCWNTAGDPNPTFNFLFDELSLWDMAEPPVSIDNSTSKSEIDIFPNPSSGIVNLKTNGFAKVRVLNALGGELKSFTLSNSATSINLDNLVKGFYFIQVDSENATNSYKLILN